MMPEVGKVYACKRRVGAIVRKVVAIEGEFVLYEVLHGPRALLRKRGPQRCKVKNFIDSYTREVEERDDYSDLDGCKLLPTYLVLDTKGTPLLRCGYKKGQFYLRKGYAKEVADGVLQYTDETTEKRFRELYGEELSEFFMAVKNDRCVVCGRGDRLTQHHVVPTRHKHRIPQPWRSCLSNVLFVCLDCHQHYEDTPEPVIDLADWQENVRAWRDHFLAVMQPSHLPPGWDIITVKNLDAAQKPG